MESVVILILMCFSLSMLLFGLTLILSEKVPRVSLAKGAPFECGFTAKMPSRAPFSLQFFLIALVFLIFDMELILLYPAYGSGPSTWYAYLMLFFAFGVISMTTLWEWSNACLEWVK